MAEQHKLVTYLKQGLARQGLNPETRAVHLVVAFSGGPDSTAMFHALADWRDAGADLRLTVVWVNHAWREQNTELPLLHQHVMARNVPLTIVSADKSLPKTEGAGREYRYRQLTGLAQSIDADAIVTGHHADDQAETILFRLLRGTGLDGLVGIRRRLLFEGTRVPVVRPMLDAPAELVRAYLRDKNLRFFEDPTNTDIKFQRNLIRQKILPQLQQDFPNVKNALFRLAAVAEGDLAIIESRVDELWQRVTGKDAEGVFLLAGIFNAMDAPYQRRLLKRFLQDHDIACDFAMVEETLDFVRGDNRRKIGSALKSLPCEEAGKKRFLSLYKDHVRVLTLPAKHTEESVDISRPGLYIFPGLGLEVETKLLKKDPSATEEEQKSLPLPKALKPIAEFRLDPELGGFKDKLLQVRTRKPGDKFHPAGMPVPLRLKNWLINKAIPRFKRDYLPVVAYGEHVLWAKDMGMSMVQMTDPEREPLLSVTIRKHDAPEE